MRKLFWNQEESRFHLIYHNIEFPRTHFLGTLLEQCRQIDETFEELDEVIELSVYAVDVRYPDDTMEIGLEDAREAFEMATRVKLFVPEKVEEQQEQIESAEEEWEEEDEEHEVEG